MQTGRLVWSPSRFQLPQEESCGVLQHAFHLFRRRADWLHQPPEVNLLGCKRRFDHPKTFAAVGSQRFRRSMNRWRVHFRGVPSKGNQLFRMLRYSSLLVAGGPGVLKVPPGRGSGFRVKNLATHPKNIRKLLLKKNKQASLRNRQALDTIWDEADRPVEEDDTRLDELSQTCMHPGRCAALFQEGGAPGSGREYCKGIISPPG